MDKNFCIFNGELVKISELNNAPVFAINESVKEDIRLYNTKPLCLGRHVQYMEELLQDKEIAVPKKFTVANLDLSLLKAFAETVAALPGHIFL